MIDDKSSYFHVKENTVHKRHYEPDVLLNNLVRKRKLELNNVDQLALKEDSRHVRLARACEKEYETIANTIALKVEQRTVKANDKGFSITRAVADLIDLNSGAAKVKIERDLELHRLNEKERCIHRGEGVRNVQKPHHTDFISIAMPSPSIPLSSNRQSFILSLSVFKQYQLIRRIKEHLPLAHLVERVFNSDITLSMEQGLMAQKNITSEADVILSPTTGLIWTSLQRIKQRSLPGQKSQSPIRKRLRELSAKYEQIIFLISRNSTSNGDTGSHHLLDESDCDALADIHGFGAQLDCHLTVYFIPGEGTDLIKWIIAMMGKYGKQNEGSFNLLEDESLWELFLRSAGLNAFAAQDMLYRIKQPSNSIPENIGTESSLERHLPCMDIIKDEKFALHAIITMSEEERISLFEPLIGGRVLQRFNEILGQHLEDAPSFELK